MNKREFKDKINEAEIGIVTLDSLFFGEYGYATGVCLALSDNVCEQAWYEFERIFSPDAEFDLFWLGNRTEENLEKRRFYLRMFEQYCLVNKVYLEF